MRPRTGRFGRQTLLSLALIAASAFSSADAQTKAPAKPATIEAALTGAEKLGDGVVSAWRKGDSTLMVLPAATFKRLFLWYSETVTVPTGVVDHLWLGGTVVRFQRRGSKVFVRDLTAGFGNRVGQRQDPIPGQGETERIDPISISVRRANEPPIIGILPVLASSDDGGVLVDVTKLFANDIAAMSARKQVVLAGLIPAQVNPAATYITSVRVFPENFGVRTHLTFIAKPKDPVAPPRNVSMRIGHSLVMLPEKPMAGRRFDPRVGYFRTGAGVTAQDSRYVVYGTSGNPTATGGVIMRYRLEKKDPKAAVSDPVSPIVFYIGREVPDRWRSYLKAAVESWQPAFEAAGFSNAIVARDAPSFKDDPDWTPEDARHSVIRWLAQPNANATGPHIVDPRSGEILSSHVEVWPQVIEMFSRYYFGIHASIDERAATLPLSEGLQGRLLQYAVAHEIGHAIGLRHNHLASTAYSVKQMRDPAFANTHGAGSSIMAYGRWNQAAQPGDGITRFIPGLGAYDRFAIRWGYGSFGSGPEEEKKALAAFTDEAQADRALRWAAGELPGEIEIWLTDPRVALENTGAERVEATKLGIANILRAVQRLPAATGGDSREFVAAYETIRGFHVRFLKSVARLVAGIEADPWNPEGAKARPIPAAVQRAAIRYLLGEGASSLEAYKAPDLASRAAMFGTDRVIAGIQVSLIDALFVERDPRQPAFAARKLVLLQAQKAADPGAYGPLDFAEDSYDALWGDLAIAPEWRRILQRAWLERLASIFKEGKNADPAARKKLEQAVTGAGLTGPFAASISAIGAETVFSGWARDMLPELARRLDRAADDATRPDDRYHFVAMAALARRTFDMAK